MQGSSVAISADGNTVVEGGYGDNYGIGAVWVFTRKDGVWSQDLAHSKLVGSGNVGAAIYQGVSVAISGDGKTILEGGNGDNDHVGAAWAFSNLITGVAENDIATPSGFSLEQNYPNPFTSITTIKYIVTELGLVSIKIFDAMGNEIASLMNEKKPVGEYSIVWNASGLQSGIYFCRLQSGTFSEIKKLVLQK